jgi:outer membrane lipoprotein-sorting protein
MMRSSHKAGFLMASICLLVIYFCASGYANERIPDRRQDVQEVLTRLESRMSGIQTLKTNFVQEKKLAVLERSLVLKGTVFMQKPALLAWHVREPLRYSLVIDDEVVRQWDEETDRIQRISLSKNVPFKTVLGQMKEWFSGTYSALLEEYDVTVLKGNGLALRFVPRSSSLAYNVIKSVTIVLREDERYIHQLRIEEKGGDSTILTFVDTLFNVPIDSSAWEVKPSVR